MDSAQTFDYHLKIHQLRPWPLNVGSASTTPQFIAIGWQRGKQTGSINAVKAKVTAKGYGVYMFDEDLKLSAKLRKNSSSGSANFEKKFLQLAAISVHRGNTEDHPLASLGTVVINLADFTDVKRGPKKLAFRVSVGKDITGALAKIGKSEAPSLIVTIQSVKKGPARALEPDASFSSRGSRITGDISTFFSKDKAHVHEATSHDGEEPQLPPSVNVGRPAHPQESSDHASTPGLPQSDLRATPINNMTRFDSEGYEIESSEDARPGIQRRRSLNRNTNSSMKREDTPPNVDKIRNSMHLMEDINSRKNRMNAIRGEKVEPSPALGGDALAQPESRNFEPGIPKMPMKSIGATSADEGNPAEAEEQRRATGKTTFIRDWLGSAEPAPGEGPSIRFVPDSPPAKRKPKHRSSLSTTHEENAAAALNGNGHGGSAGDPVREHLVNSLSTQRRTNDLRLILDQDRINKESESFANGAEEPETVPTAETGSRAVSADGGLNGQDSAAGEKKSRAPWRRRRTGSMVDMIPETHPSLPGEIPAVDLGASMMGGEDVDLDVVAEQQDAAAVWVEEERIAVETRREEAIKEQEEKLINTEAQVQEAEIKLQQAEQRVLEAERKAAEAEQLLKLAEDRVQQADAAVAESEQRVQEADARVQESDERAKKAELAARDSENLAAAAAKRVELLKNEAESTERQAGAQLMELREKIENEKQKLAIATQETARAVTHFDDSRRDALAISSGSVADSMLDIAPSASLVLSGPLPDPKPRDIAPRKTGRELKWRRASQTASALTVTKDPATAESDLSRIDVLEQELRNLGILETAVHSCNCFQHPEGSIRSRSHLTHTPARRLFRALISLPMEQAEEFVPVVLQTIRYRVSNHWAEDVPAAVFWWSNVQMLRLFLHQLDQGEVMTELSEEIFDSVVYMLWQDVMLPMQERSASHKSNNDNSEEDAIMQWIACLDVANDRVSRASLRVEGFSSLLLPLLQAALLARVDFLFYSNLMSVGCEERPKSAFDGRGGWGVPPHMLPFTMEGRVSFQTGMQLKMAVMHLSQWAHDHDLRDREGAMLHPFTRSTADALMMKKDLLLDDETRLSVASALPVLSLLHLLSHFTADEFSPDEVDESVLDHLRDVASEVPEQHGMLQCYMPPSVEELNDFAEREIMETKSRRRGSRNQSMAQISVQIGDDSDAELQELVQDGGNLTGRFKLVQDLWSAAHDRRDE